MKATLRQVFNQTSFQVIGKVITSLTTILILRIIVQNYGESGTGVLTLALTYLAFFSLATDFGVNAYVLPNLLKENYELEWRKLFGLRVLLILVLIPLSWSIVYILSLVDPNLDTALFRDVVLAGSVASIIQAAVFITTNAIFQSKLRYDLSTIALAFGAVMNLFFVYFFASQKYPLPIISLSYSFGWITMAVLALFFVKKFIRNILPIVDLFYIKNVFKNSWAISLTLILNVVYFRLDSFLITFFRGFADVGIYNLAYSIFQAALVLPSFIMNSFYPLMIRSFEQNKNKFRLELIKAAIFMFGLGLSVSIFIFLFSDFIIFLLTSGKGFYGSSNALQILAFSFPAFFASSVLMWALVTIGRYKTMLVIYLIGLFLNGILNFLYIPFFSYSAAAVTTGVCEYLILLLQVIILYRYFKKV